MTRDDEAAWALRALGRHGATAVPLAGSMSSSSVHRVAVAEGEAVLKVSRTEGGPSGLQAARCELEVYLSLAQRLPVRTPRLIDHRSTDEAVILLLSAHQPAEPATSWGTDSWLQLAGDLAALHDSPVPSDPQWHRGSWLDESLRATDVDQALRFWSRPGEAELLGPILRDTAVLADAMAGPAPCFLHGDCHTANLLREDSSLVWTDWQSAGVGSPAADLAFPSVRAVPDGARLPHDAMRAEYAARRGLQVKDVTSAAIAAELAIFLVGWPPYAQFESEAGVERVHRRVSDLAHEVRGSRP